MNRMEITIQQVYVVSLIRALVALCHEVSTELLLQSDFESYSLWYAGGHRGAAKNLKVTVYGMLEVTEGLQKIVVTTPLKC